MAREKRDRYENTSSTYYERNQEFYSPYYDSGYDPGKDRLVRSPEWEEGQYPEDTPHKTAFRSSLQINPFGSEEQTGPRWSPRRAGPHTGKGPKGYRRSDERIYDDVCEILTSHPDIDATDIEVRVSQGVVTLSGIAHSRTAKRLAEDVSAGVPGVHDVENRLRIPPVYTAEEAVQRR